MRNGDISQHSAFAVVRHPALLEILFQHKQEIFLQLSDVRGLYHLEHFSIHLLNPLHELMIFSMTPSVEFNLMFKDLWQFDKSYLPHLYKRETFFWWEEGYLPGFASVLNQLKKENHGYTLGFCVSKPMGNFSCIYSFATRHPDPGLKKFYKSHKNELMALGDYSLMRVQEIYARYCHIPIPANFKAPILLANKPHLRLIVNNVKE